MNSNPTAYLVQHIQYFFFVLAVLLGAMLTNFLLVSDLPPSKRIPVQIVAVVVAGLLSKYIYEHSALDFSLFLILCIVIGGAGEQVVFWLFWLLLWKNKSLDESLNAGIGLAAKISKILSVLRGTDTNQTPPGAGQPPTTDHD